METMQTYAGLGRELAPMLANGLSDRYILVTIPAEGDFPARMPPNPWHDLQSYQKTLTATPSLNVHLWTRDDIYEGTERA